MGTEWGKGRRVQLQATLQAEADGCYRSTRRLGGKLPRTQTNLIKKKPKRAAMLKRRQLAAGRTPITRLGANLLCSLFLCFSLPIPLCFSFLSPDAHSHCSSSVVCSMCVSVPFLFLSFHFPFSHPVPSVCRSFSLFFLLAVLPACVCVV